MKKLNMLTFAVVIAGAAAAFAVRSRLQMKLSEREAALRSQDEQLKALSTENQRLSNPVDHRNDELSNNPRVELAALRDEAAALKMRTNELARQTRENLRTSSQRPEPPQEPHPPEFYERLHQMAGKKPLEARNLAQVFRQYVSDHNGQSPATVEDMKPYLAQEKLDFSGTNQFEIVYRGDFGKLQGIPPGAIAVVRDSHTWVGPDGKLRRVYGMADGSGQIVESDDDFRSWESQHIISSKAE